MSDLVIKGITGNPLLRKPNNENDFWRIEHIYQGDTASNYLNANRIPNVGDIVIDTTSGYPRWLEVQFVDETTLIPTMVELVAPTRSGISNENKLLSVGPGYQHETWRLFLDKSVTPHVFIVDSRLHVYGKESTKYKIFIGTDTSATTGRVISMNFNANGQLLSEDLPLELVAFANTDTVDTNVSVKHPRKGFTTTNLQNGDLVTMVTYSDEGHATSYNTLLVHNTALDRSVEESTKYVTTIAIESPFLDKTENNTLIFPMNIPRDALAIMGVVTYSDGSQVRMPIDGNRLTLSGLDNYVPMKKDQNINLVLTYRLPKGEMALNASVGNERFIAVKYFGRTLQVDGSYSVNLFPIPTYINSTYGWKINYMLYTLDRDISYDVTNVVTTGANTEPLNPLAFNETQDITVSLDLQKVDPRLKRFIHVQTFKIALMGDAGPGTTTPWIITYEKDQNPKYGANMICKAVRDPGKRTWQLDISCGSTTLEDWLERIYYRVLPLTDKYSEIRPPRPTHFTITINNETRSFPIKAWNQVLQFNTGATDGYGVMVQFTRVDSGTQYQLAASPLCFVDISEGGVINHASTTIINEGETNNTESTVIDIDTEVQKIADRGASDPIQDKYRQLLERIKRYGLLRYEQINGLYQRIRTIDVTPAQIANDVILLEQEVNRITISDFNRERDGENSPISSIEHQRS